MRKQCIPGVSPPPSQTPGYEATKIRENVGIVVRSQLSIRKRNCCKRRKLGGGFTQAYNSQNKTAIWGCVFSTSPLVGPLGEINHRSVWNVKSPSHWELSSTQITDMWRLQCQVGKPLRYQLNQNEPHLLLDCSVLSIWTHQLTASLATARDDK